MSQYSIYDEHRHCEYCFSGRVSTVSNQADSIMYHVTRKSEYRT